MAARTKRDQVVAGVVSEFASQAKVVDMQIRRTPTLLAPPSVSLQYVSAQLTIGIRIETNPGAFGSQGIHDAFRTSARNSAFSG